jgi:large repetitive protein
MKTRSVLALCSGLWAGAGTMFANSAPLEIAFPADAAIECGAPSTPAATGVPGILAYCGTEVCVTYSDETAGGCPSVIERTWTVTDGCANATTSVQRISISATLTLLGVPQDATVECGSVPDPAGVTAAGGCGGAGPTDGLVLYYPFDENLGDIVLDASGGGRTGTVNGATWVAGGALGGAYRFDSSNQNITATDAGLPSGDMPRTMAAWVKLDTIPTEMSTELFSYGSRVNNQLSSLGFDWRLNRDKFNFSQYGGVFLSSQKMDQTSTWYHVVYTYGGSGVHHLYVNGALSDGVNELHGSIDTVLSGVLKLGGHPENLGAVGPEGGYLDEVRVYNRAVTAVEAQALYNQMLQVQYAESSAGSCPEVVTRTWTVADGCGSSVSATQTITVVDTQPPTVTCPPDGTVACGATTGPEEMGVATATDGCGATPDVNYSDEVTGDCPGQILRTWTAEDACGNSASCVQTITIEAQEPLTLVGVPADVTVECGSVPGPAEVGAEGGCAVQVPGDGLVLHYAFNSDEGAVVTDLSPSEYDGVVTGAVYTAGGLSGGAMQFDYYDYIEVGDVLDVGGSISAMTVCAWVKIATNDTPAEMFIAGRSQGLLPYTGTRLLSYFERPACDLTASYPTRSVAQSTNRVHDGQWHLFCGYFHTATNLLETKIYADGVLAEENQLVGPHGSTVTPAPFRIGARPDNEYPFKGLLDDVRVYNRELSVAEVAALYAAEGAVVTEVTYSETAAGSCPQILTRVWSASDGCGNSVSATQTITVVDTQAPAVTCPPDMTVACGASTAPADTGAATATDACDETPTVTYSDEVSGSCPGLITRTWTAEDGCGNSATCVQHIAIQAPLTLVGVPEDMTVECGSVPAPAAVTASGGCVGAAPSEGLVLYYPFDEDLGDIVLDASGGGRTGTVNGATWVAGGARDGAYRFDNIDQNITATDAGLPSGDMPRTMAAWVKLDTIPTEMSTEMFSYGTRTNNQLSSLGFDWRLNRDKFNFSQYGGVFLSSQKMDQASTWRHVVYTYGGSGAHHIYIDGQPSDGLNELGGPINTVLAGALKLGGHPENLGAVGPEGGYLDEVRLYNRALTAAEAEALYDGSAQVEFSETAEGICPQVITRTWTATDGCGNSVSATQTITVVDTKKPVVSCPPDVTVACGASTSPEATGVATAAGDCDATPDVNYSDEATGDCPGQILRTWTAEDACGNTASCVQTITIEAQVPLTLVGVPADVTVECGSLPAKADVGVEGGCSVQVPGEGLVLHYAFNLDEGTVVTDLSPSEYDGVVTGAVYTAGGLSGGGMQFDYYDYIDVRDVLDVGGSISAMTVCTWVKIDSSNITNEMFIAGRSQGLVPYTGTRLVTYFERPFCDLQGSFPTRSYSYATNEVHDGKWHLLCAYFHSETNLMETKLWVDGALADVDQVVGPHASTVTTAPFRIGTRPDNEYPFQGLLDDVRVYNRELSAAEVAALYTAEGAPATEVTYTETASGNCPEVITRVWTASDGCGNSVSATQTITVVEAQAPLTLVGVPADVTVECGSVPAKPDVEVEGGCAVQVPGDGLVLHYAFNSDEGVVVTDLSPSAYDGVVTGAVYTAGGRSGGGMQFDYYDYIEVGDVLDVGGSISGMTVCAWVKIATNDTPAEMFIAGRSQGLLPYTGTRLLSYFERPACDLTASYPTRSVAQSTNRVHDGQWHLFCGYFHAATNLLETKIYADGVLAEENQLVGPHGSTVTPAPFRIGARPDNEYPFKGLLDDVRVYNRELSAAEVAALYAAEAAPATEVTYIETAVGSCPQVLTRIWSATDACGNSMSATQTITVVDSQAPAVTCPPDVTVACGASTAPADTGVATATDVCDAAPVAGYIDEVTGGCPGQIARTWTAEDACGNKSTCVQTITVMADEGPLIEEMLLGPDGSVEIVTAGGAPVSIEASCDMVNWTLITTPQGTAAAVMGKDQEQDFTNRFYRAVLAP